MKLCINIKWRLQISMNYLGSKSRIAKHIVPIIQKAIDYNGIHYYLEPMCGGLNIIDKIRCDRKFAYDLNKYLIYLFIHIKEGGQLPETMTKEYYDALRTAWYSDNKDKKFQDWEIGLLWLSSFSGRGPSGGASIEGIEKRKDGTTKIRHYYQERKNNLLKQFQQPLAQDILFGIGDYRDFNIIQDYCIYLDPPYFQKKEYENSKDVFNHDEFWNVAKKLSMDNIVFISEQYCPDPDFQCIWQQEVSRSIKATDKSRAVEKLFIYKGGMYQCE